MKYTAVRRTGYTVVPNRTQTPDYSSNNFRSPGRGARASCLRWVRSGPHADMGVGRPGRGGGRGRVSCLTTRLMLIHMRCDVSDYDAMCRAAAGGARARAPRVRRACACACACVSRYTALTHEFDVRDASDSSPFGSILFLKIRDVECSWRYHGWESSLCL